MLLFHFSFSSFGVSSNTHIRIRCAIKYHQICHFSAHILRANKTKTILRKKKNKEKITLIHELVSNMCHLLHKLGGARDATYATHASCYVDILRVVHTQTHTNTHTEPKRNEKKRKWKTTNGKYQWKWVRKKARERKSSQRKRTHISQLTLSASQPAVARKTFSLLLFNNDVGSFHLHEVYFILQTSNSYKDISICGRPRNAKCWRYIASCDFNASVCVMFGFQAMTIKTRTNGDREKKKCENMLCESGDSLQCTQD